MREIEIRMLSPILDAMTIMVKKMRSVNENEIFENDLKIMNEERRRSSSLSNIIMM